MRVGVAGNGKMGKAVAEAAGAEGIEIIAVFDRGHPLSALEEPAGLDVVIDVSSADAVGGHVRTCLDWNVPIVVGTTGIGRQLEHIQWLVESNEGAMLYSPNFSIGVAVLRRALRAAVVIGRHLDGLDISIHEVHHRSKQDRPSGTALLLSDDVQRSLGSEAENEPPEISAFRVGTVFGEHTVRLEGCHDRIVLHHEATSRRGFAMGALKAARWLVGRRGYFTMDDFIDDLAAEETQIIQNFLETAR